MNLKNVRGAVEHEDHFAVDAGGERPFRVAKAGLSDALQDRVRRLYCGGRVQKFAAGGTVGGFDDAPATSEAAPLPELATVPESMPLSVERLLASTVPAEVPPPPAPVLPVVAPAVAPAAPAPAPAAAAPVVAPEAAPAPVAVATLTPPAPVAAPAPTPAAPAPAPAPAPKVPDAPEPVDLLGQPKGGLAGPPTEIDVAVSRSAEARAATLKGAAALAQTKLKTEAEAADELAAQAREAEDQAVSLKRISEERKAALETARAAQKTKQGALLKTDAAMAEAKDLLSPGQRIGLALSSIAMAVGYAMSGRTDGAEMALKTVNDQVDRMVTNQRQASEAQRSARLRDYTAATGDVESATRLYDADLKDYMAAQARSSALKQTSAQARRALDLLAGQLILTAAQSREEALNYVAGQRAQLVTQAGAAEREAVQLQAAKQAIGLAAKADVRAEKKLSFEQRQLAEAKAERAGARAAAQAQATAAQTVDEIRQAGLAGAELSPDQFKLLGKDETPVYVPVLNDSGRTVYRRAIDPTSAKELRTVLSAKASAIAQLAKLEQLYSQGLGRLGEARQRMNQAEAVTKDILTAVKDVKQLGALTAADLELIEPMIPKPSEFTTLDETNKNRIADLRRMFNLAEEKAKETRLTIPREPETSAAAVVPQISAPRQTTERGASPVPAVATAAEVAAAPAEAPRLLGFDASGRPILSTDVRPALPGLGDLVRSMLPDPELSMLRRQASNPQLTERARQRYRDQVAALEAQRRGGR